jgi:hypothetical protein
MADSPNPFNIIKHRGDPQKAEFEGVAISREEKLFVPEWNAFVTCAPYDNHFIFEIPVSRKKAGMSDYMCTCGAAGVVAKPEGEKTRMFVCLFHATYGYHSTAVVNKDDFDRKDLGDTIEIEGKSKKWLI